MENPESPSSSSSRAVLRQELARVVPSRITALHYIGPLLLVFLGAQIVTGLLLLVYYRPLAGRAFQSVATITDEVRLGWAVRGLHHWGADLLIVLCLLHMYHVYFSRAYVRPRQSNWVVGSILLLLVLAMSFTGLLLPWDQRGYWFTAAAHETISRVPLIGTLFAGLFWGGWEMGEEVLLRFHALHVGILPWVSSGLLLIHLFTIWRLGMKEPGAVPSRVATAPSLPDPAVNLFIACLFVGGLWLTASTVFPPTLQGEADPLTLPGPMRPPWYLLPLHGLFAAVPGAWATVLVILGCAAFVLVPLVDRAQRPGRVYVTFQRLIGVAALAVWVWLGIRGYLE